MSVYFGVWYELSHQFVDVDDTVVDDVVDVVAAAAAAST